MLKHTFSPSTFRKEKYIKINLTTTDSTQIFPIPFIACISRKETFIAFGNFQKSEQGTSANSLFSKNFQHLPQSNTFKRFINDLNGAIVFTCVQKTQARILRKSHFLTDGL